MVKRDNLHTLTGIFEIDPESGDGNAYMTHGIDLFRQLSYKYGRLIRQGQVAKVVGIDIGLYTVTSNNEGVATGAGQIYTYAPTKGRVDAWWTAFDAAQNIRKSSGLSRQDGYDFRVGLHNAYGPVAMNAALVDGGLEGERPLYLYHSSNTDQSIFDTHNEISNTTQLPRPHHDAFGLQAAYDDAGGAFGVDPDRDGVADTNYGTIFLKDFAATDADTFPWSAAYVARFGDPNILQDPVDAFEVNQFEWRAPANTYLPVMNGLIGITQTLTSADDAAFLDQGTSWCRYTVYLSGWHALKRPKK